MTTAMTSQSIPPATSGTLAALSIGQSGRVQRVGGSGTLRRRLMELGLVAGATVTLVRVAPLGDPLQIRVRGYDLAMRRAEAQLVELLLLAPDAAAGSEAGHQSEARA